MIKCQRMTNELLPTAEALLSAFLSQDEYYLDSSPAYGHGGRAALKGALELFLTRPELGFVWVACDQDEAVGVCVVCYAISTSIGAVVAKLDDVFVKAGRQSEGIGSALLEQLKEELRKQGIRRIDTSVHFENHGARRFYEKHGFLSLHEERLACVL